MRRGTSNIDRLLQKIYRSSLLLLNIVFKAIAIALMWLAEYMLTEIIFWFVTLGVFARLLITVGISPSIAYSFSIIFSLSLCAIAAYISYASYTKKKPARNKRQGEAGLAYKIGQNLDDGKSQQWHEYQDWLHDIMLSRRQLLDEQCPRWKVKLITYRRLGVFCAVVGMSKVRQVAVRIGRSR